MKSLHQVLVAATPADAITSSAMTLRNALRATSESEIFAWYVHPDLEHEVLPAQLLGEWVESRKEEAALVFHASIGSPDLLEFLMARPERIVLVYHNLSPADELESYDPGRAANLREGRRELEQIRPRVALAIADSDFNAAELLALGYESVSVIPLPVDATSLSELEPDPEMIGRLRSEVKGPALLFVGQVLPHKRIDTLIQAFHCLVTFDVPDAHLLLAGADRVPGYRSVLQAYLDELNLGNAKLLGALSDAELAAVYRSSTAFVTLSDHEGFCVPLLEAMSFDLPIVAKGSGAVPQTLGGAGLLLRTDDGPLVAAEAMKAVLQDEPLRTALIRKGRERLGSYVQTNSAEMAVKEIVAAVAS